MPKNEPKIDVASLPSNSARPLPQQGTTEYDTIPSYLYFIKAAQEGNAEGMDKALRHVAQTRGPKTATDLAFIAKRMQTSDINNVAKNGIGVEGNPEIRKLYAMINENPNILSRFQFALPNKNIASSPQLMRMALEMK